MSYINLNYHLIFSTKERCPSITTELMLRLGPYIGGIIRQIDGQMLTSNGPGDHIHIATILNQKTAIMDVLRKIKGSSSEWIHTTFPDMRDFAWQDGYAAFTVSHSAMPKVVDYIKGQIEHHKKLTFQEELIQFLNRHGVKYDERYIWE